MCHILSCLFSSLFISVSRFLSPLTWHTLHQTPPSGTLSGPVDQGQVCLEDTGLNSHWWSWSNRIRHEDRRLWHSSHNTQYHIFKPLSKWLPNCRRHIEGSGSEEKGTQTFLKVILFFLFLLHKLKSCKQPKLSFKFNIKNVFVSHPCISYIWSILKVIYE